MADEILEELVTETKSDASQEIYVYPSNSLPGISMAAVSIMDMLKDWNKKLEKNGSKELHPSYLLTIDKIIGLLGSYGNLGAQAKTAEAVSEALQQIVDTKEKGKYKIAYIYPFIFKDNNRISVKFPIFIANKEVRSNARPFRNACFKGSIEMVNLILKNRAAKTKTASEENPGELIIHKNKAGLEWLFPKVISLEFEIQGFLKKGFLPYNYIPQTDFITDFIQYAKENNAVTEILPDYHIIVDDLKLNLDGTFKEPPEIIFHYRTQADALEKFSLKYLNQFAQEKKYDLYRKKLSEYTNNFILQAEPGHKQSRNKINNLITLIEEYPFDSESSDLEKRVREVFEISIKLLKKLIAEIEHISSRHHDNLLDKYIQELPARITKETKNKLNLLEINLRQDLINAGVNSENLDESIKKVKDSIRDIISFQEVNDVIFAVDQGYMAAVLHKLSYGSQTDLVLRKQYSIAKSINARISNPKHSDLNSKIQPDQIARLNEDIRNTERMNNLRNREMELRRKFNSSAALTAFLATLMFFLIFSLQFGNLSLIFAGVGLGSFTGFMAGRFFRIKSQEANARESDINFDEENFTENSNSKEEKLSKIARSAETIIFPKRFNKIAEKIYDAKSLKKVIFANIDAIRTSNETLLKEPDLDKVTSTIEYAVMQNAVTISIPDELVPKNKPNAVIFHKDDLKASMIREQIGDHYRELAEKSAYDKQLVNYYKFLINSVEMEYYKYLPGKKR